VPMSRVLLLGIVIIMVACSGPFVREGALAQPSDVPSRIPGNAGAEKSLLSWLAARPVGLRLAEVDGQRAMVRAVQAGSAADHAGLQQGDILVRVGDLNVPSPDQAAEHINNAWTAGKSAIDLVVSRAGHDFYIALLLRD
jgi:serine protease Do